MNAEARRLIEDYLLIQVISAEASREKSVGKAHTSMLHFWWARTRTRGPQKRRQRPEFCRRFSSGLSHLTGRSRIRRFNHKVILVCRGRLLAYRSEKENA
jgi:hypothetical protein